MLIAWTLPTTVAPQVRLNGAVLNVLTGTEHDSVVTAVVVDPSQKLSSGLKVMPSLCKICIWYAVMLEPPLYGWLQLILMKVPCKSEEGGRGTSGILAAKIAGEVEDYGP